MTRTYIRHKEQKSYIYNNRVILKRLRGLDIGQTPAFLRARYFECLSRLISALEKCGSIREDNLDSVFTYSTEVDPDREIVIVVNDPDQVDYPGLFDVVLESLNCMPAEMIVTIDGLNYITICKNGEVIGCSHGWPLSETGFP